MSLSPPVSGSELHVRVRGAQIDIQSSDGRIHDTLDNAIGVVDRWLRRRLVVSIGMSLERMRASPVPRQQPSRKARELARVRVVPALDPGCFEPQLAAGFVRYIMVDATHRLGVLPVVVELDIPGFESIPEAARSAFFLGVFDVPLRLNGRARWTPSSRERRREQLVSVFVTMLPTLTLPLWIGVVRPAPQPLQAMLVLALLLAGPLLGVGYRLYSEDRERRRASQ